MTLQDIIRRIDLIEELIPLAVGTPAYGLLTIHLAAAWIVLADEAKAEPLYDLIIPKEDP